METVRSVLMTPVWASVLLKGDAAVLKGNIDNRRKRPNYIDYLIAIIKAGGWYLSNDAIVVDFNGVLRNGQHRLEAIMKSGIPCAVLLVENADPKDHVIYDTGVKRDQADNLGLDRHLVTDARQMAFLLGRVKGGRVSEQTIKDIGDWWAPMFGMMRRKVEGFAGQRFGAIPRLGYGLRTMITDSAADRDYVLDQYRCFCRADVPRMTVATSTMWKRISLKTGQGRGLRIENILLLFHGSHPGRHDLEPVLRTPKTIQDMLVSVIMAGADAYARGPAADGWPYVFKRSTALYRSTGTVNRRRPLTPLPSSPPSPVVRPGSAPGDDELRVH